MLLKVQYMEIKLYTTHCPQCKALETKLDRKSINYSVCENVEEMQRLGFSSVPVLQVDNNYYNFLEAVRWVNELK